MTMAPAASAQRTPAQRWLACLSVVLSGLPFLVISAGTSNHFALDLGLKREDPTACLGALADGVRLWVDLGLINGQTLVNNASFGAYTEIVQSPAYRGDKVGTTLDLLPDGLQGHSGGRLAAQVDGTHIEALQGLLVPAPTPPVNWAGLRQLAVDWREPTEVTR